MKLHCRHCFRVTVLLVINCLGLSNTDIIEAQNLNVENMPPGFETAKIINSEETDILKGILMADFWLAYPELERKYKTDLEKETFLKSAEGESLQQALKQKKPEIMHDVYITKLYDDLEEYNVKEKSFIIYLAHGGYVGRDDEEQRVRNKKNMHVINDIWFNDLPIKIFNEPGFGVTTRRICLVIKIADKNSALEIERQRENLAIWVGLKLTGSIRKISYPPLYDVVVTEKFIEAKDATVMLVNTEEKKVIWWKKYVPAAPKK